MFPAPALAPPPRAVAGHPSREARSSLNISRCDISVNGCVGMCIVLRYIATTGANRYHPACVYLSIEAQLPPGNPNGIGKKSLAGRFASTESRATSRQHPWRDFHEIHTVHLHRTSNVRRRAHAGRGTVSAEFAFKAVCGLFGRILPM